MVKFKFLVKTPRGEHYNTHYAKSKKNAKSKIEQWNAEFKGTGYSVTLVSARMTTEKIPEGYVLW